jgi:hypothetical protein
MVVSVPGPAPIIRPFPTPGYPLSAQGRAPWATLLRSKVPNRDSRSAAIRPTEIAASRTRETMADTLLRSVYGYDTLARAG